MIVGQVLTLNAIIPHAAHILIHLSSPHVISTYPSSLLYPLLLEQHVLVHDRVVLHELEPVCGLGLGLARDGERRGLEVVGTVAGAWVGAKVVVAMAAVTAAVARAVAAMVAEAVAAMVAEAVEEARVRRWRRQGWR